VPNLGFAVVRDLGAALAAAAGIGYPVVVKPVAGVGKAATAIVAGPAELRAFFDGLPAEFRQIRETQPGLAAHLDDRFIVEELAVGELYSVEYAADAGGGGTALISVGRKMGRDNQVLELGCTVPSGLDAVEEDELGRYAGQVCRALGLAPGIFHVEAMLTERGFRLIEANPRISGGSLPDSVALATGENIFHLLVDIVLGAPVPARPLPSRTVASHSFLAAAEDAAIPADLPADWFEHEIRPLIHSGWFRALPGAAVAGMRTNWDSFGLIRTTGADAVAADAECARVRRLIEGRLGFELTPIGATRRGTH
jgi:biotin carboxylase